MRPARESRVDASAPRGLREFLEWRDEVICDASGWCFKMPRLTRSDIERLELDHWDLADYVFGTAYAIVALYKPVEQFDRLDRLLWSVENRLRYWEWRLRVAGHNRLWRLARLARMLFFRLAFHHALRTLP